MSQVLSVSLITKARRRLIGVRTVASGALNRQIPQEEFVSRITGFQHETMKHISSMQDVVKGLWKCEGLSTSFGKHRLPDNTLNDPRLPREVGGITHVGYGAATTEFTHFDPAALHDVFQAKTIPEFRGFAFEGIGSALRIYEPGFFKIACEVLGLIAKGSPAGPDKTGFFSAYLAHFSDEYQRLITHGYGRLMCFSSLGVFKAIDEALTLPAERVSPAVQGIGFALAMMNAEDMGPMLASSAIEYPAPTRIALQTGLVYGIIFCDWFAPGFLSILQPKNSLEVKLVEKARAESALNQKRGYPLIFQLENPLD